MPLSWNEIKSRALAFTQEWKDESSEDAEAKSFWDEFFFIFDIRRRKLASFEYHVKQLNNKDGFVDLFWPGVLIVEHKSKGRSLDKAHGQAIEYFHGIADKQLPQYILVSDFARFRLYDLENGTTNEFKIEQLVDNIGLFGFIAGYQKRTYKEQDPVNIEAAELMGRLHDKLKAVGYEGHHLELYLVRLVFLLFADDTNIFNERGLLFDYLDLQTKEDGSDLAATLSQLFEVLNTPTEKRLRNIDETLGAFPYVNGKLFEEHLPIAAFDSSMRKILIDCCKLDWGKISPAIFGSLFQSVMDAKARRNLGAHYTSEKNILKLIKPLFLDELHTEYNSLKESKSKLKNFHDKISGLRFLDPACGCGNFLIIAYRELRLLEIDIIKQRLKLEGYREEVLRDAKMDISHLVQCDVDKFYGIEYEEFPAQIAQVAMWLIDHQMNQLVSNTFGEYYVRLPLRKSATIVHGNALRVDWQSLLMKESTKSIYANKANIIQLAEDREVYETVNVFAKEINYVTTDDVESVSILRYDYILGNPPFIGSKMMTDIQRGEVKSIFHNVEGAGVLDYVSAWYLKAANYLKQFGALKSKAAFVSTNSITQGEQVYLLWGEMMNAYQIKIHFAHRTFNWSNEAKANAAVHVVIIGFANFDVVSKQIFEYINIKGEPQLLTAKNINPYLVDGIEVFLKKRTTPICNVPRLSKGNQPTDGGYLLLSKQEMEELVSKQPAIAPYIKKFVGAQEFIQGIEKFCLWLVNANPAVIRSMPLIMERLENVRKVRALSTDPKTREMAYTPGLFRETYNYDSYVAIPEVSSERREYIPMGFLDKETIPSNKLQILPTGNIWHFGILMSKMQMAWAAYTCGRLKSDFQYSASIVYNNFPWPENPTDKQKENVETCAQAVLDARAVFQNPPSGGGRGASLADLYDPNSMPPALVKAHQALDKAVDLCYRPQPFINETKRIEFLFELYDKYTAGMFVKTKSRKNKEVHDTK